MGRSPPLSSAVLIPYLTDAYRSLQLAQSMLPGLKAKAIQMFEHEENESPE